MEVHIYKTENNTKIFKRRGQRKRLKCANEEKENWYREEQGG